MVLLRKIGDAIVRRARGGHQRRQLGQRIDRDQDGTDGQGSTGDAIRHPDRNRRHVLIGLAQPHVATLAHAPPYEHRLTVERMPGIVNRYVLSVVGGM
jgi:hypothetical protein